MRYLALALAAISLVSCSRDPNYLKQKYLNAGTKYYDAGRYKEARLMFMKSVQEDRKFGLAYYHLALTDLKEGQITASVGALRRAVELVKPGTDEANDAVLKLSEVMVVAAQAKPDNDALIKEVQANVDGLLKRNPERMGGAQTQRGHRDAHDREELSLEAT